MFFYHKLKFAVCFLTFTKIHVSVINNKLFKNISILCLGRDSDPHGHSCPSELKSDVAANFTTKANSWSRRDLNSHSARL